MLMALLLMAVQTPIADSSFILLAPPEKYYALLASAISSDASHIVIYGYYRDPKLRLGDYPIWQPNLWLPSEGKNLIPIAVPDVNILAVANDGAVLGQNSFMVDHSYGYERWKGRDDFPHGQTSIFVLKGDQIAMLKPHHSPSAISAEVGSTPTSQALMSADGKKVMDWSRCYGNSEGWLYAPTLWQNGSADLVGPWRSHQDFFSGASSDLTFISGWNHQFESENNRSLPFVLNHGNYEPLESRRLASYLVGPMSGDGSTVVGVETTAKRVRPVIWRNRKFVELKISPQLERSVFPFRALTYSGKIAVGSRYKNSTSPVPYGPYYSRNDTAVICDGDEVSELDKYLSDNWGLAKKLEGLKLVGAVGISADGNTIVGQALDSKGVLCVFVATHR